jgi:hypothetical protein
MESKFCISKSAFKRLFAQRQEAMLLRVIRSFDGIMTREMMLAQQEQEEGAFSDAMKAEYVKFGKKTENVEVLIAFQLADFYFSEADPDLCFEMRRDFSPDSATSYDSLVAGIESNIAIDCSIKANGRQFNFQIKRYPQEHLPHTSKALTEYIKKTIAGYGPMKGTSLVLLLQPNSEARNDDLNFRQVHEEMVAIKSSISFDEIVFVFNDSLQNIRWQQVFPKYGYSERPLVLLSDKYKAQQEEWKKKTI